MSSVELAVAFFAGFAAILNLFRITWDLLYVASNTDNQAKEKSADNDTEYGAMEEKSKSEASKSMASIEATAVTEATSLISGKNEENTRTDDEEVEFNYHTLESNIPNISLMLHGGLLLFFLKESLILDNTQLQNGIYMTVLGILINIIDMERKRFFVPNRILYISSGAMLFISGILSTDIAFLFASVVYLILTIVESKICKLPEKPNNVKDKPTLSKAAILILLKPYFWPDSTTNSAFINRILVSLTWLSVILGKVCNLIAPVYLGKASTALSRFQYGESISYSVRFVLLSFLAKLFKEGQSLLYLKVAQAAFVQLSEQTFHHIHTLSLDWHLRKKLGDVLRSMDRGIAACDTLMKYLFLLLIPALAECIVVCIIFASYFKYYPLSVAVFLFVFVYIVMTILMTLWRKKFRKAVAKSDNDWHDKWTDSLINFETVKYFTGEQYEKERFSEAISTFQAGSVNVQASLSLLNLLQQLLFQTCLATALALAALGIKQRSECCLSQGCSFEDYDCCEMVGSNTCPGMEIGDFIAVLTYTINLFAPLNFLGSIYNAVIMAIVDLTSLSELLAEEADVLDASDAIDLPSTNQKDPDIAVEFDDVYFNYPSQPENSGLKGLSFKMKRGTVTAVVGSTGAGKTTVSRLFFRFYDVLHGAVKINGVDVRSVSQKSLRKALGVVPQNPTMFNDTIQANVLYGRRDATQEDLDKAMRGAQLEDLITSLPLGWNTMVGDRGLKLSGGEKQRTAIARCLLKDPAFVVLDEATSALDTLTENAIQEALERLGKDRTVLVIAHRLGTVRNADNIVVLDDGVVSEQGTHDELLELDGKYADMWKMQLQSPNMLNEFSPKKASSSPNIWE